MDIQGKLASPEFQNSSLPLTVMLDGKKAVIGRAMIDAEGFVRATVDDKAVEEKIRSNFLGSFVIKLNPEVRLESRSVMTKSQNIEPRAW